VTVVVATYNRAAYLPDALRSILNQSLPVRRLIVVDDGSTDATEVIARGFGSALDYCKVKNGGKAKAVNSVLESIDTSYLMVFDDDDALYPDAIETLYQTALDRPDCAFVFGSHDTTWHLGSLDDLTSVPVERGRYAARNLTFTAQRAEFLRDCTIMLTGALVQTAWARRVGGLDPQLKRSQDYGFLLRLAIQSKFEFCGKSVYVLRQHDGARGAAGERHGVQERVRVWAAHAEHIGRWLIENAPLETFDPIEGSAPESATSRRRLLHRAWALAPKTTTERTVEDLFAAFSLGCLDALSESEVRCLRECLHDDFLQFKTTRPLYALSSLASRPYGAVALGCLAKGAWWLSHEIGDRRNSWRWRALALWLALFSKWPGLGRLNQFKK
jgi:hypothetical protein